MKNIAIKTLLSPLPMHICCSSSLRTRCPERRTTLVSSSTNFCRQIKALHTLLNSFGNSKTLPHVITPATAVCSSCISTTMTVTHRRHEDGLPAIPPKPSTPIHVVWATYGPLFGFIRQEGFSELFGSRNPISLFLTRQVTTSPGAREKTVQKHAWDIYNCSLR